MVMLNTSLFNMTDDAFAAGECWNIGLGGPGRGNFAALINGVIIFVVIIIANQVTLFSMAGVLTTGLIHVLTCTFSWLFRPFELV